MYNATFMVNIWNAIATRDIRLMTIDQSRLRPGFGGCWINYARCHDDIGWGFNEEATRSIGLDPYFHKQFLIRFFEGQHEDSFSRGELYEFDEKTMDARNSGTLASLCGLETSSEYSDQYQQELAVKRIILIHSLVIASRGIPLIYSGDELATVNAYDYKEDDSKAHDSRWLHRIPFDWNRAALRNDAGTVEGIVFQAIKKLIAIRKGDTIFSSTFDHQIIDTHNQHIYCMTKEKDGRNLVALFNFSEYPQVLQNESFLPQNLRTEKRELFQGKSVNLAAPKTLLGPYEFLLLI
jgi:amylosucrase